jgi:hypothetical protein
MASTAKGQETPLLLRWATPGASLRHPGSPPGEPSGEHMDHIKKVFDKEEHHIKKVFDKEEHHIKKVFDVEDHNQPPPVSRMARLPCHGTQCRYEREGIIET